VPSSRSNLFHPHRVLQLTLSVHTTSCACVVISASPTVQIYACLIARILFSSHRLALPLLPPPRRLRNTGRLSVCPSVPLSVSNFHVKNRHTNRIFMKISPKISMCTSKNRLNFEKSSPSGSCTKTWKLTNFKFAAALVYTANGHTNCRRSLSKLLPELSINTASHNNT